MPSTSRSSRIPVSFDRFRIRSIQFFSPFRNHQCEIRIKESPERSRIRKTKVHPTVVNSSESGRKDHDAAHLFIVNKESNTKPSSLSKANKSPIHFFNTEATSNVVGVLDLSKLNSTPIEIPGPTPRMIRSRQSSVPVIMPKCVVKRPQSFDHSIKKSNSDQIEQFNA